MKKLFSSIFITLLTIVAVAQSQDYTTINVTTPGTLKSILDASGEKFIFYLKVTGNIDARDIYCLRDNNPALAFLDLTEASIIGYIISEGTPLEHLSAANELPEYSFRRSLGKTSLVKVRLPNTITSINIQAFFYCTALTDIVIPNNVTNIGKNAFTGCNGLTSIIIPNSVNYIGQYAFYVCGGLTDITIGNSVSYIDSYAFQSCSKLKTITCLGITPPVFGDESFSYLDALTTVYVPAASLAAYQASKWGAMFFRLIQASPTNDIPSITSRVKVYSARSSIIVEGTALQETVTLYSITGKHLKTNVSTGERLNMPVDKQGIYLVKTGGKTYKVVV